MTKSVRMLLGVPSHNTESVHGGCRDHRWWQWRQRTLTIKHYVQVAVNVEDYCSWCRINLIWDCLCTVPVIVMGGGYSSRCSRLSEWKQALLTTCDDIDNVIKACATSTFPFCRCNGSAEPVWNSPVVVGWPHAGPAWFRVGAIK